MQNHFDVSRSHSVDQNTSAAELEEPIADLYHGVIAKKWVAYVNSEFLARKRFSDAWIWECASLDNGLLGIDNLIKPLS